MRFKFLLLSLCAAAALCLMQAPKSHAATRLVLFEETTQWNCPPCAGLNPLFEAWLKQNPSKALCIRYHGWWPGANDDPMYHFNQADHDTRIKYYGIDQKGEPCTEVDGSYEHVGFSSAYITQFQSEMNTRLGVATPLTLAVTQTVNGGTVNVSVTATSTAAISGNYKLRVALVQPMVDGIGGGTNGETEWENVVRKMLPDASGSDFSINAGQSKTIPLTYNLSDSPDPTNCFVVAWVQNEGTHEVINAATDAASAGVTSSGPTFRVGAPNGTATFNATAHNYSTRSQDIAVAVDAGTLPLNWEATFSINGTTYTDPQSITVAAGDSAQITVAVKMTDGNGLAAPSLTVAPAGPHSSTAGASMSFAAISSDLHTVVIDGDGGNDRQLVYEQQLQDLGKTSGTLPVAFSDKLFSLDSNVTTAIYVCGMNGLSAADIPAITSYLNRGGNLFLTGEVVATELKYMGGSATNFLTQMLHTTLQNETGAIRGYAGVSDPSGIGAGVACNALSISNSPTGFRYYPDGIKPADARATIFAKYTGVDTACGLAITGQGASSKPYKVVFLPFALEAMSTAQAQTLTFTRVWNWLNAGVQATIQITDPKSTTVWEQGTTQLIQWNAAGITTVKISYSLDNGSNWTVINGSYDGTKGFISWQIPSLGSTYNQCFVKIENSGTGSPVAQAGPFTITNVVGVHDNPIAVDFRIDQNFPNPASASTLFTFDLPRSEHVTINVYDTKGALVATVLDETRAAGTQSVSFEAGSLAAGAYEYRMTTPTGTVSKSMTIVKQ